MSTEVQEVVQEVQETLAIKRVRGTRRRKRSVLSKVRNRLFSLKEKIKFMVNYIINLKYIFNANNTWYEDITPIITRNGNIAYEFKTECIREEEETIRVEHHYYCPRYRTDFVLSEWKIDVI